MCGNSGYGVGLKAGLRIHRLKSVSADRKTAIFLLQSSTEIYFLPIKYKSVITSEATERLFQAVTASKPLDLKPEG